MVLVVHSFPTEKKVLQFEWDWHHPEKGSRVRKEFESLLNKGNGNFYAMKFKIKLLSLILNTESYCRLPLGIYIMTHEFDGLLKECAKIPPQMKIHYGKLDNIFNYVGKVNLPGRVKKTTNNSQCFLKNVEGDTLLSNSSTQTQTIPTPQEQLNDQLDSLNQQSECYICNERIKLGENMVSCSYNCGMKCHIRCLGRYFTQNTEQLIPTTNDCPKCKKSIVWGDLIKMYKDLNKEN